MIRIFLDQNAGGAPGGGAPTTTAPTGEGEGDWRQHLPEDQRDSENAKKFNTLADLLNGYGEAQSALTRAQQDLAQRPQANALVFPGENATEAQWKEFRKAAGIPEDGKYNFPDDRAGDPAHPERGALRIDDALRAPLAQAAFDAHMTQGQFDVVTNFFLSTVEKAIMLSDEQVNADHQRSQRILQERFGSDLPARQAQLGQLADAFGQPIGEKNWYAEMLSKKVFPNGLGNDGDFQTLALQIIGATRLERAAPPHNGNPSDRATAESPSRLPAGRRPMTYNDMTPNGMPTIVNGQPTIQPNGTYR